MSTELYKQEKESIIKIDEFYKNEEADDDMETWFDTAPGTDAWFVFDMMEAPLPCCLQSSVILGFNDPRRAVEHIRQVMIPCANESLFPPDEEHDLEDPENIAAVEWLAEVTRLADNARAAADEDLRFCVERCLEKYTVDLWWSFGGKLVCGYEELKAFCESDMGCYEDCRPEAEAILKEIEK